MTSAALQRDTRHRDPDIVMINLRLTQRQVTLMYGLACMAHAFGTRTGTVAAGEGDAAAVLDHLMCVLYVGLYDAAVRGGL